MKGGHYPAPITKIPGNEVSNHRDRGKRGSGICAGSMSGICTPHCKAYARTAWEMKRDRVGIPFAFIAAAIALTSGVFNLAATVMTAGSP